MGAIRRYLLLATFGLALISTACGQGAGSASRPSASAVSTTTPAVQATPVEQGFQGFDLTFVSDSKGWALGAAKCPALQQCAAVARTEDSGASWTGSGQIDCVKAPACVRSIRFGSAQAGYAYGPSLFHTLDGGQTWQQETDNLPTLRLEYAGLSAFRVAGNAGTLDCFGGCRVQRAPSTGGSWADTGIRIQAAALEIVPEGSQRIYVFGLANSAGGSSNKKATIYYSTNAGGSWQSRGDPCPGNSFTVSAATAPTGHIAILCGSNGGSWSVVRSDDSAQSFHGAGTVPITASLTMGNASTLSGLEYTASGTVVDTSFDGGAHWQLTLRCPKGPGATGDQTSALGYQDAKTAHIICPGSTVWRSQDGGATWAQARFNS